ncbi:uncharacterized protein LOC130649158 [Hydractinia symbiolongicarpus]|uniref:uncharacterized protein LOC130649158 n=1 Tax=Hydractinia symbiolongicarpus TaxID=13093 RepID=UPI00254F1866|nr:uncharacterized protein LOC130649158 [Hydractinia symbiolongicarpus]
MKKFKILSVVGMVCVSLAALTFIVGLTTKKWVVTSIYVEGGDNQKAFITNLIKSYGGGGRLNSKDILKSISMNLKITSSLKHICLDVEMKSATVGKDILDLLNNQIKTQTGIAFKCHSISDLKDMFNVIKFSKELTKKADDVFNALDNVYICIVVAANFAILALIGSFIKLPCFEISKKQWITAVTISCAFIAAITTVCGMVFLKEKFHLKTDLEDIKDSELAKSKSANKELYVIFNILRITEKYGYSYILVCVGFGLLVVAIFMNIREVVSGLKNKHSGYV